MILKKLDLKNYKIHQELSVDFSDGLNLIQGNNETGKSTIIDAIHKVLFLKAKGGTKIHKDLRPIDTNKTPEVKLVFMLNGVEYTVHKIFGGTTNYLNQLSTNSGELYKDDEADEQLSKILKEETGISNTNLFSTWNHLFAFQGDSGESPEIYSKDHQVELFQSLNTGNLTSLIISDKDKLIANAIKEKYDDLFTERGEIRRNTDLSRLTKELEEAEANCVRVKSEYDELIANAIELEDKQNEMTRLISEIEVSEKEYKTTLEKKQSLAPRLKEQENLNIELADVVKKNEALAEKLKSFQENKKEIDAIAGSLKNLSAQLESLNTQKKEAENNQEQSDKSAANIQKELSNANLKLAFIKHQEVVLQVKSNLIKSEEYIAKITSIKEKVKLLETKKAGLLKVTDKDLNSLEKKTQDLRTKNEVISSIATTLTFDQINGAKLLIGDEVQAVEGQEIVITENARLVFPDGGELNIAPGNKEELNKMNEEIHLLASDIQSIYNQFDVKSYEELSKMKVEYEEVENKIVALKEQLEGLDEEYWLKQKEANEESKTKALNSINKIEDTAFKEKLVACDEHQLTVLKEEQEQLAKGLEVKIKSLKSESEQYSNEVKEAQREINALEVKTQHLTNNKFRLEGQMNSFKEDYTSVDLAKQQIEGLITRANELKQSLSSINAELQNVDLNNLDTTLNRLKGSMEQSSARKSDLDRAIAVLKNKLNYRGETDLNDELDRTYAQKEEIERQFKQVEQNTQAIKLLHNLFASEQKQITEDLTQPFIDKVNAYLSLIFGQNTSMSLETNEKELKSFQLIRVKNNGQEFMPFESLSSGAKEQFSSCVRLAMAEILSGQYNQHLPVFLDESFNNTDLNRMDGVKNMLYSAAKEKGLQLILLSSKPTDYNSLGANVIDLNNRQN